jgi:hypothetical protein
LLLITGLILSGCANQLPPRGGPMDKVPPQIVEAYPASGTTNFSDDHIEFVFSKYIDKRTLQDALFISPAIEGQLQFDWTGTSVTINFPGKLKKNITYVVTVGTDLQDYNNHNKMSQAFNLTFSTGSKIDKGEITGRVFDSKPNGIMIYAYMVGDSIVNPMVRKPDYISQTGDAGTFKLLGLMPAVYRVFAVRDQYKEFIYRPEDDDIGMPALDVKLTETDTLFRNLNFFITKLDTVRPRLVTASIIDKNHILVNFTKEVDSTIIRSNNFLITDSTENKTSKLVYAFKGNTKPTEIILVTKENFPSKDELYLTADSIKDKFGNVFTNDFSKITLSDKPDTTKPMIFKSVPSNSSGNVDYLNTNMFFYFNDAFDTTAAKGGISFSDTSRSKIPYNIYFIDDASFKITAAQNLETNKDYIIKLNLNVFKGASGNSRDSIYQYRFKTINGLDFTGISGAVENVDFNKNPYLILQGLDEPQKVYQQRIINSKKFKFDRIEAGKYMFWGYYDTDSSKTYSYGKPFPFKPAEQFSFYPDTLDLRARWSVTNAKFIFK